MKQFHIEFGALSPKIADQLKEQGLTALDARIEQFQKAADSINYLKIHGLLTYGETQKARKRFISQLAKVVKPID